MIIQLTALRPVAVDVTELSKTDLESMGKGQLIDVIGGLQELLQEEPPQVTQTVKAVKMGYNTCEEKDCYNSSSARETGYTT